MSLVDALRARTGDIVDALGALVAAESPSDDPVACDRAADVAEKIGMEVLGHNPERVVVQGRTHLKWRFGSDPQIVLLGHIDTVWGLGTLERWPFEVEGDRATGPGCFDMKAGVVQMLFALGALDDLDGVVALLTCDEEIGSPSSRALIDETAADARAVLVLEPSAEGSLKTSRKGGMLYRVDVTGRAAHAGLDPEKGVNAVVELARQTLRIHDLADAEKGTTVTPSRIVGGTTTNTVPSRASVSVDARAFTSAEQDRVATAIEGLQPVLPGAELSTERLYRSPPLERTSSAELYAVAQQVASELGLDALTEKGVGGGSDGNFTAGLGVPTLDGLGAVGDGAHAEGEWVSVSAMPERAALVAGLVERLRA